VANDILASRLASFDKSRSQNTTMKLKSLVILSVFLTATATVAFSTNFRLTSISGNKTGWHQFDKQYSAMSSSGDTMFVDKTLNVWGVTSTKPNDELSSKSVVIMIENGGALNFLDENGKTSAIFLGSGSKIVIASGGELTADAYDGMKKVVINNTVVATASGDATGSTTDWTSTTNYTDPNGSLPSYPTVETSGGVDGSGALPVTWGFVELKEPTQASVTLNWSTMSEMNDSHFGVQLSTDGASWNVVDVVESKAVGGNSAVRLTYSNEISLIGNSSLYYIRLRQVDFDGQFDYSDIVVHRAENLFPSGEPRVATLGQGTIEITGNNFTHLSVYTAHGQLIWDQDIQNTTQVHLDNTGAHWLLFSNKSGQIFKVKHMVTY